MPFRLLFGKYKGRPLSAVPCDYIAWLMGCELRNERLRDEVATEIGRRVSDPTTRIPPDSAGAKTRGAGRRSGRK
jgi:hypothetical protein